MRRFLKDHPWVWVVGLIVLVLGFEGIFFWIANSTLGEELEPIDAGAAIEQVAPPAAAAD